MNVLLPETPAHQLLVNRMIDVVRERDTNGLEYHNAEHPCMETFPISRILGYYCVDQGIDIDFVVSDASAIGHDYDFAEPLQPNCFPSKEHRSAHNFGIVLRELAVPERQVRKTQRAIISTEKSHPYRSPEEANLGIADMINTYSDYDEMLIKTFLLRRETQRLLGKAIPAENWLRGAVAIISDYHAKKLPPELAELPFYQELMASQAENIAKLKLETPKSFLDKTQPFMIARAAS